LDYKRALVRNPSPAKRLRDALERRYYRDAGGRIVRNADAVLCVSERLREVLIHRYALTDDRARRLHVLPTFASRATFRFAAATRARVRAANGLDGRYVVIYSGNLRGAWQVPHKLVEAFAAVRAARDDAFFLVLSPEADHHHIAPHLTRAGLAPSDYRLQSAAHAQVVEFLCAADVGLLLRDRHPMNEAASPRKF